jgi:acetoacetyl-CoA synthetase
MKQSGPGRKRSARNGHAAAKTTPTHLEDPGGGPGELILFLRVHDGSTLDDDLRTRVVGALRGSFAPSCARHLDHGPRRAAQPYGQEAPAARQAHSPGDRPEKVASRDTLADPGALTAYIKEANSRQATRSASAS